MKTRAETRGVNGPDEIRGYNQEDYLPVGKRMGNGWGGSQTRLPKGHLARRDTVPTVREAVGTDRRK